MPCRRKAEQISMSNRHGKNPHSAACMKGMVWLCAVAAAVTFALRAAITPALRDSDTGRFVTGGTMILLMLAITAVLYLCSRRISPTRLELTGRRATAVSLACLAAGGCMLLSTLWDIWRFLSAGILPPPDTELTGGLSSVAVIATLLFGVLGGAALIWLGLLLTAEGATRRGMLSWSSLAPVLWMWLRLMRYEMSYASALGLAETFYDFSLFILELVFLFKFARYVSGVGQVSTGSLLFFSCGTAVFGLSGPLTKLCMYLIGDSEAYEAAGLAGIPDLTVGMLALVLAFALLFQYGAPVSRNEQPNDLPPSGDYEDGNPSSDLIINDTGL